MDRPRTGIIIQARSGSTRLPGKVLLPIHGRTLVARVIAQALEVEDVDVVVLATTALGEDDALAAEGRRTGAEVFRGSVDDVLDRYHATAAEHGLDVVVRLTADCPLVDPGVVHQLIGIVARGEADIAHTGASYPEGMDAEALTARALDVIWSTALKPSEREHVTAHAYANPDTFRIATLELPEDRSDLRVVVDEPIDLEVVSGIIGDLETRGVPLGLASVLSLADEHPGMFDANRHIVRNEGYLISLARETDTARGVDPDV